MIAKLATLIPSTMIWMLSKVVTEAVMREVAVILVEQIGTEMVKRTSNQLDDKLLAEILKAIKSDR